MVTHTSLDTVWHCWNLMGLGNRGAATIPANPTAIPANPTASSRQLWHGNGSARTQRGTGSWQKNGHFTLHADRVQSMGANTHPTATAMVRLISGRACFRLAVGISNGHQQWASAELNTLGKQNVARNLAVGQQAARVVESRALSPKGTSLLNDRKNNFCPCQLTFYGLGGGETTSSGHKSFASVFF